MATHRRSMSGLKVEETEKWGNATAYRRYGRPKYFDGAPNPPDHSQPQDRVDQPLDKSFNDVGNNWLRGAGKGGEGYQNFDDHRPRGAAPRRPKAERSADPGSGDVHGWAHDGGGSPFSAAAKKR